MNIRVYRGTTEISLEPPEAAVDNIGECYAHPDDGWLYIKVIEHDDGTKSYEIIVRYSILNGGDEPVSLELQNAEECEVKVVGELDSVPPGGALLITESKPITEAGGSWSFDVNLTAGDGTTTKWKITGTVPE